MNYYISALCPNQSCNNRSIIKKIEAISSSAAKNTVVELNNSPIRELCPSCNRELVFYVNVSYDDKELENDQSLHP